MKKFGMVFLIVLVFISSCTRQISDPDRSLVELGGISMALDMKKAPAQVVNITGFLARVNFDTTFLEFTIAGDMASCFVNELEIGSWSLTVNAINSDGFICFSGNTTIEIIPGQIVPVNLNLVPTTGGVDITITWGVQVSDFLFGSESTIPAGYWPNAITKADLDQDSDIDLVVTNYQGHEISIYNNNGAGLFIETARLPSGYHPAQSIVENFDNEGCPEIAVANYDLNNPGVTIFSFNADSNKFVIRQFVNMDAAPSSICSGDFDGDGDIDLAAAIRNDGKIAILKNNGLGTFYIYSTQPAGNLPIWVVDADFDGDGDLDLAVSETGLDEILIFLNDGNAGYTLSQTYSVGFNPWQIIAADLDGDQDIDLITTLRQANQVRIFKNNGNASFFESASYSTGSEPSTLAVGDLDNDGDMDFATANIQGGDLNFFSNNDNVDFTLNYSYALNPGLSGICFGDWNDDSYLDVVVANMELDQISIIFNQSFE